MSIQPVEGIVLGFQAKYPGPKMQLRPVDMRFSYHESFDAPSPDAYETLLWDVMKNDATLFMRADQVEAAWQWLMPVLDIWAEAPPSDFPNYAAGTWGPEEAPGSAGSRTELAVAYGMGGSDENKAESQMPKIIYSWGRDSRVTTQDSAAIARAATAVPP
jgi:hypothetical protein